MWTHTCRPTCTHIMPPHSHGRTLTWTHTHRQAHSHPPAFPSRQWPSRAIFLRPGHLVLALHQGPGERRRWLIYKVLLSRGFPWGPGPGCPMVCEQEISALHLEMLLTAGRGLRPGCVRTPRGARCGLHQVQRPACISISVVPWQRHCESCEGGRSIPDDGSCCPSLPGSSQTCVRPRLVSNMGWSSWLRARLPRAGLRGLISTPGAWEDETCQESLVPFSINKGKPLSQPSLWAGDTSTPPSASLGRTVSTSQPSLHLHGRLRKSQPFPIRKPRLPVHIPHMKRASMLIYAHFIYKMCTLIVCVQLISHFRLFVTPQTVCSPPGSSVHGILQARLLEWVAISFSRGSSQPRDQTHVSCVSYIGRWVLYH